MVKRRKGQYVDGNLVFRCCVLRYEHLAFGSTFSTYPIEAYIHIERDDYWFWRYNEFLLHDYIYEESLLWVGKEWNYIGTVLGCMKRNKRKRMHERNKQ